MTTPNEAKQAIYSRFITAWSALDPAVPCFFDNEATDRPDAPSGQSWCRLGIRESESAQASLGPIGARRYDRRGSAVLNLYAASVSSSSPTGPGIQRADAIIKVFRDTFEGVEITDPLKPGVLVHFNDCQVTEIGTEGSWWRVDALAQFWFEEIK